MIYFFLFLLGLAVGSFINCLVYRLSFHLRGEKSSFGWTGALAEGGGEHLGGGWSLLGGRSFCDHCRRQLAWYDNIPLLSFILLGGRCRYCRLPIDWQYPLVELGTGIITIFIFFHLGGAEVVASSPPRWLTLIFLLLLTYALIVIFVSDLNYQIIPDQVVYLAILISLIYQIFLHLPGVSPPAAGPLHLGGVLLASVVSAVFFFLLFYLTRGRGMGLGDVKLAALMGLFLGFPKIIIAFYLAFLTGAIFGVILVLLGKKKLGETIPFGPFLVAGTFISLFCGEIIWQKIVGGLL